MHGHCCDFVCNRVIGVDISHMYGHSVALAIVQFLAKGGGGRKECYFTFVFCRKYDIVRVADLAWSDSLPQMSGIPPFLCCVAFVYL